MFKKLWFYRLYSVLIWVLMLVMFLASYFSLFLVNREINPVIKMTEPLISERIYMHNPKSTVSSIVKSKDPDAALYSTCFLEKDQSEYQVIYLNRKAIEYGIYLRVDLLYIVELNKTENIQPNVLYTLNKKNSDSNLQVYRDYRLPNIRSSLIKQSGEVDFARINFMLVEDDYFQDIEDFSYIICEDKNGLWNEVANQVYVNENYAEDSYFTGKALKNYYSNQMLPMMVILSVLSFLPLLISFFSLVNIYSYKLNSERKEILVDLLYYKNQRKVSLDLILELLLISTTALIPAAIIMFLAIYPDSILTLLLSILLGFVFNLLLTVMVVIFGLRKRNKKRSILSWSKKS